MNKKEITKQPAPLTRVRKRLDRWRSAHRPHAPFPEQLWSEAVALAQEYGHSRTARALRLDYNNLKKHLESVSEANSAEPKSSTSFVELFPSLPAECTIELEKGENRKMRISLKGGGIPDVASLSRAFWSGI